MQDWMVAFVEITDRNPTFKGLAIIIAGLLALLFARWMQKRWNEPVKDGFVVFIGLAIFAVIFGLFILIFQPQWWALPY